MALTNTPIKVQYDLSGGAVASYVFGFRFWATSEVKAMLSTSAGDTLLTEGVDYSVSAAGVGGTVTILSTLPAATRLTIYRELAPSQETSLVNGGVQDAEVYMDMVDRTVALVQQSDEVLDRIVRFPITDPTASPDMPSSEDRAQKFLAFTVTGDPIAVAGGAGGYPVTDYMATVLDDETAQEAQETLLLASLVNVVTTPATQAKFTRATTTIIVDVDAAGAHVALDIQAGATTPGDRAVVITAGSADRVTIVTYGSGAVEYVPVGTSREFVWTGTAWLVLGDAGEIPIGMDFPVDFEKATSTKFPAFPRNINQDISITNWPLIVPEARSKAISILGVTNHAVTVAGAVITLPVAAATTALLQLFINDGTVTNYMNGGEIANFTGGAVYNVAGSQRCVTILGVDYTITAIDAIARTITVSVAPPAGAQSLSVYPYRVAGNANVARFLRIAGFVGVAAGDAGGEVVGGFRKMDRGQGHRHQLVTTGGGASRRALSDSASNTGTETDIVRDVTTDGVNGTTRTGKTTDPRTAGQYAYTWGGKYIP